MKRTTLILALAIALPAWGQEKPAAEKSAPAAAVQEAEKPEKAAEPAAKPEASAETPKKTAAGKKQHSRRTEDARHCLDKPSNEEIIKCAEAYL
jgi:hypothetical protein